MRWLLASALIPLTVAGGGRADVIISVPFVTIRVSGPGRAVRPVSEAPPALEPPPGVLLEIGPPVPQVGQAAPTPVPSTGRPPTLQEFAFSFRPCAGIHQVVFQHPFTGAPVAVTLALPPGVPAVKIKRGLRQRLQFQYGRKQIEIVFLRNGRVRVHQ